MDVAYRVRLVQSIQLGFIFSWKQESTILSNTYLTEFSKNQAELKVWKSKSAIKEDNFFLVWGVDLEKNKKLFLLFGPLPVYV